MSDLNHEAAFVCSHVFDGSRPVLVVAREGGDWQLLCGDEHRDSERPHVVGLNHLFDRDATLCDVLDLPEEWEAERSSVGAKWERYRCDSAEYE